MQYYIGKLAALVRHFSAQLLMLNEHSIRNRLQLNLLLVCIIEHTVKNSASLNHWEHFALRTVEKDKGDIYSSKVVCLLDVKK